MTPAPLPTRCDVLVIGAGPAGSACAQMLARAGRQVLLVDQHDFPRDKICGDGLIPDSHAALRRLGVFDEVAALATPVQHVRCVGPRGGHVDVPGSLSVLPRKQLDHILVRAAGRAGARLATPWRFESPLLEGERIVGARLKCLGGEPTEVDVRADWVVLATGAVPQALTAAGLCERHTPSGVALRGYVKNESMVGVITQLQLVWHPRLRGGYGWIFPAPGGLFNIGAGQTGSHLRQRDGRGRMEGANLRDMFKAFAAVYAPAGELMRTGTLQGSRARRCAVRCRARAGRARACWPPAKPSAAPMRSAVRASVRPWKAACWLPRPCCMNPKPATPPCSRTTRRACKSSSPNSTCTKPPAASTTTRGWPIWSSGAAARAHAS